MLLAAWCLLYELRPADAPPVAAFCRTFSDREVLGGLVAASAFVVFLTSVGSLIFYALPLGAAVKCVPTARAACLRTCSSTRLTRLLVAPGTRCCAPARQPRWLSAQLASMVCRLPGES